MTHEKERCESELERLRALVRQARHFARWMANPMGIVGKNKPKAVAWLEGVDAELGLKPWECEECGLSNDPDDEVCLGVITLCAGERPPETETTTG